MEPFMLVNLGNSPLHLSTTTSSALGNSFILHHCQSSVERMLRFNEVVYFSHLYNPHCEWACPSIDIKNTMIALAVYLKYWRKSKVTRWQFLSPQVDASFKPLSKHTMNLQIRVLWEGRTNGRGHRTFFLPFPITHLQSYSNTQNWLSQTQPYKMLSPLLLS
jgi:hypothetical protein